jgi:hypothetical protein
MIYSYTQISQYLSCPRRYRYRYLDGWQEKDTWANMLFGRAFEKGSGLRGVIAALSSYGGGVYGTLVAHREQFRPAGIQGLTPWAAPFCCD